jgi:chromosome segregation ATPase
LTKRNVELEEVLKKYSVKKMTETEASREISRLIEQKAKTDDDIIQMKLKKGELERRVNELQRELEDIASNFEKAEKNLDFELETIKIQVEMTDNEKVDKVRFDKENLKSNKRELLLKRQMLIEKWQNENRDFQGFFDKLDEQKKEIRMQISNLKAEKEMLKKEKEELAEKELEFKQEQEVEKNNKRTVELFYAFQDPKALKNLEGIREIIEKTASKIMENDNRVDIVEPGNEMAEFLCKIQRHKSP